METWIINKYLRIFVLLDDWSHSWSKIILVSSPLRGQQIHNNLFFTLSRRIQLTVLPKYLHFNFLIFGCYYYASTSGTEWIWSFSSDLWAAVCGCLFSKSPFTRELPQNSAAVFIYKTFSVFIFHAMWCDVM